MCLISSFTLKGVNIIGGETAQKRLSSFFAVDEKEEDSKAIEKQRNEGIDLSRMIWLLLLL